MVEAMSSVANYRFVTIPVQTVEDSLHDCIRIDVSLHYLVYM